MAKKAARNVATTPVATTPVATTPVATPVTPSIEGAVMVVFSCLLSLLKGEVFSPSVEVNGKKYLSGGSLFRKMNVTRPEDKKALQPTIDGVLKGTIPIPGVDPDKVSRIREAINARFPVVGVCYRPNFQWSAPRQGETKMTFGLGRDWILFQQRWESSVGVDGPDPDMVASQYGSDEYGPLMSVSYATHVASEAIKHGMALTPPTRRGKGRRRDVPSIASTTLAVDDVLKSLGL